MTTTIKRFDLSIAASADAVSKTFELDKTITAVKGILLTSDKDDLLYYRGSQKIEVNKEELFPDGFESKLLMCGINVKPNDRFYDLKNLQPGNGNVKVNYKDTDDSRAAFEAYRVSVYLFCETN